MAVRDKLKKDKQDRQEQKQQSEAVNKKVKKEVAKKGKKRHFLRTRMWIHYALSLFQKDRGKIPDNIQDRVMITNNVYITRYYMSSMIHVTALSLDTPFTLVGEITEYLRKNACDAIVDVTFKNTPFDIKLKDSGLLSRVNMWENTARAEDASDREKEVAARCLYTYEQARQHVPLMTTRIFITLRAKKGSQLTRAEKLTYAYLDSIGAEYNQITANLKSMLMFTSVIADYKDSSIKDVKSVITSEKTLSEMMPNSGSFNGSMGTYIGVNILNGSQFNFDWRAITIARNIYVCAPSGVGKTVLAINMCCSAAEDGYAVCIQDIKGNEFNNFINATGGYIVSLRQNSSGYINSWRMHKEDVREENAEAYFRQRVAFSKEQMIILSGVKQELRNDLEELLDSFHEAMYIDLGVVPDNVNSWKATESLTPYDVYDRLIDYLTPEVISKYSSVSREILNSLKMAMSRNGSKSYIFANEFDYADILRSPTLMFDFGILEGTTTLDDPTLFKLKFLYMRKLNAEYVAYKYSHGIKTFKVLEESQIAVNDPDIMEGYVQEYTLRRAQGQTTLLLGNSVEALLDNTLSKPLIENTRGLFIGLLEKDARESVVEKFGLERYEEVLEEMTIDSRFNNSFLFINKMQARPAVPVVKVILDPDKKYKLFTPVAQSNSMIE